MGKYFIVDAPSEGDWEQMSTPKDSFEEVEELLRSFKKIWPDKSLKIFQEVNLDE
jgi:hypothetical protein